MKVLGLFLMLFLLGSCNWTNGDVEVGNKTTMEVDLVYDAGNVIRGEVINAEFTITNSGTYPLIISEVKPGCSCTVADYPDEPIQPGDSGVIKAQVNTDQTGAGLLNKQVRIVANTTPSITAVTIRANVSNN